MHASLADILVPGLFEAVIAPLLEPSDVRALQIVSKGVSASVPRSPVDLTHLLLSTGTGTGLRTDTSIRSVEVITRALAHRLPAKQCCEIVALLARVYDGSATKMQIISYTTWEGLRGAAMFQLGIESVSYRYSIWQCDMRMMLSCAQMGNKMRQLQGRLLEAVVLLESSGSDGDSCRTITSSFPILDALIDDTPIKRVERDMDYVLYQLIDLHGIGYAMGQLFATALDICRGEERARHFSAHIIHPISASEWIQKESLTGAVGCRCHWCRDYLLCAERAIYYNRRSRKSHHRCIQTAMMDGSSVADLHHPHTRAWWQDAAARERRLHRGCGKFRDVHNK